MAHTSGRLPVAQRSDLALCHAIDVCARVSRLKDPGGNPRHDEARQYAIRDDMAGKIRLLARETLTHAIAAQLSGVDCRGAITQQA